MAKEKGICSIYRRRRSVLILLHVLYVLGYFWKLPLLPSRINCVLVNQLSDIPCMRKCALTFNKKRRGKSGVIKAYHSCTACVQSATSFLWNTAMFSPSRPRLGSCWTTPVAAILSAQTWACCTSVLSHISGLAPWRARLSLCALKQALPKVNKIYN